MKVRRVGPLMEQISAPPFERFGGELPEGCDAMLQKPSAPDLEILLFSHGRAALAWFLAAKGPFSSALICAYTCPTMPAFFRTCGLAVRQFDYGEADLSLLASQSKGRTIVLLPAAFGMAPWLDVEALAGDLGGRFAVIIDAAQSAFGHVEFSPPAGGAVLACPRKALALGDGAALRLAKVSPGDHQAIEALPVAGEAAQLKQAARKLFALMDPARESEALALVDKSEAALPDHACRISERSRERLLRTDRQQHINRRLANAAALNSKLPDLEPLLPAGPGTPFNWPFITRERSALLSRLRSLRVFATPLWPDAVFCDSAHPRARQLRDELVALPLDQRYSPDDMRRMADLVRACL